VTFLCYKIGLINIIDSMLQNDCPSLSDDKKAQMSSFSRPTFDGLTLIDGGWVVFLGVPRLP